MTNRVEGHKDQFIGVDEAISRAVDRARVSGSASDWALIAIALHRIGGRAVMDSEGHYEVQR